MLHGIIRFSLSQRLFVGIFALVTVSLGVRSWLNIPVDAFPDISPTQVKIILKAPGMTAEEVESQVTQRIETELLGIPRQSMLRSTTKYAITDITLDFQDGTDIYWARQQVNERLSKIRESLPVGLSGGVAPMSTPLSEMFMFTLSNPSLSLLELRLLLDWNVRPALRTVAGVADVNVLGGFARTYQISPQPGRLSAAGMDLEQLAAAIQSNHLNLGAGRLEQGNDVLIVRAQGLVRDLSELQNLVIKTEGDQVLRLADVAEVTIGHLSRYGAVTRDGSEAVEALVIALKNSNTSQVVEGVKETLSQLQASLPAGTEINVFYDRAKLINTAIGTISNALLQAILVVIVLLVVFLGDWRSALVVSLSLPMAALATFFLMDQLALSANLMSLGGLVIAIGMIVDSSVVVVENIVSQLAQRRGMPRLHIIYRATGDVAVPVVSGTLIILIVFSPLLTLTGLEGKLFAPVAVTIVLALFSALVISLTLVPVIASLLIRNEVLALPARIAFIQRNYLRSLRRFMDNPTPLVLLFSMLLCISLVLLFLVGKTFMPVLDEGDIIVQLEKSPTISLAASVELDKQIELALLARVPEIHQIVARTGSDEIGLDPMGLNETDIFMELNERASWRFTDKNALVGAIRQVLNEFPGINFGFTQPIQMRVGEMLTGSSGDLTIKVFGSDTAVLAALAREITATTRGLAGSVDVQTSTIEGGQLLDIDLHRELAGQFGVTTMAFARYLRSQLEGLAVAEIVDGRVRTPVVFALDAGRQKPASISELKSRLVPTPEGKAIPLGDLADVRFESGALLIEREKANRFAAVTTNVIDRDIVGFVDELEALLQQNLDLPAGYTLAFGGEFENQRRATRNLLLVIPVALLLILLILFATFQSLSKAFLILGNIPFAIMGGVIALFLSGNYLSVPASVGLIALLGVAVLNGVVMISDLEKIRPRDQDLWLRVQSGAARRLRPILMTATTAMFGLMPLAFSTGPGAELQKPLAIVVIGGLFSSTITTLYLLPLFYALLERRVHD